MKQGRAPRHPREAGESSGSVRRKAPPASVDIEGEGDPRMDGNGRTLSPGPSSLQHHRLPHSPDGDQWIRGMDWRIVVATEVNDDVERATMVDRSSPLGIKVQRSDDH